MTEEFADHPHHHAVQFYESEQSLFTTVAGFLAQGLVDGQPAIVIATPSHRQALLEHVRGRHVDVVHAQRVGALVVIDAEETLALFMRNEMPDLDAFEGSVGRMVGDLLKGRSPHTIIRAYGEMVDVLWQRGQTEAAIRLEILWNKLAATHGFALLCGYAMGNFYKQTDLFEKVVAQHSHVVPSRPSRTPREPHHVQ